MADLIRYAANPDVDGYIRGVLDGSVPVGKWARLAIERHVHDLERQGSPDFPFHFDEDRAQRILDFYRFCHHIEGELAAEGDDELGEPFEPYPWQKTVDWIVFGWVDDSGARRFREAYCEVTRGAGKTFWHACKGLFLLVADGEPGAKIYSSATKEDQAALCWGAAAEIAKKSDELAEVLQVFDSVNNRIIKTRNGSPCVFRALAADSRTADGLNPHGIINDEVHEHKNRKLYVKLKTAMGKRRQPLIGHITTAGDDHTETLYNELHEHAEDVLEGWVDGSVPDERFFAIIYCLDENDDPFDETLWPKANPSLGLRGSSQKIDHLRDLASRAQLNGDVKRDFLRMHCGIRISLDAKPITKEAWDACGAEIDWEELLGESCIGALDLSSSRDITAMTLLFAKHGLWWYRFFAWLPQDNLFERMEEDRVPYDRWVEEGWLELTPGNQIDDRVIAERVKQVSEMYAVKEWTHDPWHTTQLGGRLEDEAGIEMVGFMQDLKSFAEPTREFLDELRSGKMRHDRNPLAGWCAGNLVTRQDWAGNQKPHKRASRFRIDPIVAAIMARGRALVHKLDNPPPPRRSIYETKELTVI